MVEMIIKGLFRRYKRWNPVHPTLGAFWGMGIGIGCGVGWGPGFGPEVVGYVGAGCGAGFSVGFTFAGIGIGLPANYIYRLPYDAFMATTSGALEIAQSSSIRSMRNVAGDGWCNFRENIPGLQRKASGLFPGFGIKNPLEKGMGISNMKTAIFSSSKPMMNQLERIGSHFFHPQKGLLFSTKQLHMSTFRFTFTVTNWKNPFQLDNHKNGFNMHLYCCKVIFICCCWLSIISLASCFCFPLAKIFCSYIFSIYYFVSLF